MILVLLFFVICIAYYLYIKNHRHLSFGLGCLFFLWYGWYTSYSAFIFTHEPIIITTSTSINDSNNQQQYAYPNNNTWPIIIDATQTNIQPIDIPLIISNKNRITVNSNMDEGKVRDWAQSLNDSGLWFDIDYTSGCSASQTNWSAITHLERIESIASVWYNLQQQDHVLLLKIKQSLDYWFLNDFTEKDCLVYGGRAYKNCPCGTPGLWNQAWHYQGIDIPRYVGNICLLIYQQLSTQQQAQCIKFTSRSYSLIHHHNGLNLVNMAYNGASLALLKNDTLLLQDTLDKVGNHTVLSSSSSSGIQLDGSYLFQDDGQQNGYYGESYVVDLLNMFDMMILESKTIWLPSNDTMTAFATLVSGSEWMMIGYNNNSNSSKSNNSSNNNKTIQPPWLWQHSILSSFTNSNLSRSVSLNITQMDDMIQRWSASSNNTTNNTITINSAALGSLESTITRLNHTYTSANQGPLVGTRYFWNTGYLVHRCIGFVTTLKMGPGCYNVEQDSPRLYGGSLFTYQQGSDYSNAFGHAWDWNRVPGTTVGSNNSTSFCNNNKSYDGEREHSFIGAAVLEQNQAGVAVMDFTSDQDMAPGWQKTFFFFPSLYAIQMDLTTTTTNTSLHAVTTVLDQRQLRGDIYLNGKRYYHQQQQLNGTRLHQDIHTIWHDKILYTFETPVNLTMVTTGNGLWSASITTTTTMPSLIYTVQPNYGIHRHHQFNNKSPLDFIVNAQGSIRGAFSDSNHALALAFWAPGFITVPWSHTDDGDDGVDVFIETYNPLAIFLQQQLGNGTWVASISDPTKSLTSASIKISVDQEEAPIQYDIEFPQGQMLGSSVMIVLQDEP